ncbi:MAG: hypothetical protein AW08_02736 [Candidatus Accumulibacter adjunctus]|uniref:Type II toxin-antitoxin system RelE/ParE family toxin n=1 Tax=Candidatus Accumulibacter adjunctus TaxID=1454001 RepID=A0A011NMZ3_9PROT|nr:MAG: hypothetical protein AW08_02736 [Candidatus Accumulibacter adjunctus]
MRYEFHPEALAEYGHAARYYADCQEGLELRFMAAVEHVIDQILAAPSRTRLLAAPPCRPLLMNGQGWNSIDLDVSRSVVLVRCWMGYGIPISGPSNPISRFYSS